MEDIDLPEFSTNWLFDCVADLVCQDLRTIYEDFVSRRLQMFWWADSRKRTR
jgi:hypothetical protein